MVVVVVVGIVLLPLDVEVQAASSQHRPRSLHEASLVTAPRLPQGGAGCWCDPGGVEVVVVVVGC